jgi:hypothetical protein
VMVWALALLLPLATRPSTCRRDMAKKKQRESCCLASLHAAQNDDHGLAVVVHGIDARRVQKPSSIVNMDLSRRCRARRVAKGVCRRGRGHTRASIEMRKHAEGTREEQPQGEDADSCDDFVPAFNLGSDQSEHKEARTEGEGEGRDHSITHQHSLHTHICLKSLRALIQEFLP